MGSESEPAKLLLPFLQRADELQKHEPLVAYYCRLYAMEKGLNIPQKDRTKTTSSLLVSLMNQLEKDKKSVKLGPEDNLYIEGFASNIFAKADKQDRAGRADLNTAKIFYAASIFFEILSQFGELQPDIEQKLKYAVWKAADIRKALKEGRRPEPGPPGGEKELPATSSSPKISDELGHSDSFSSSQPPAATSPRHVEQDLRRSENFTNNYPSNNNTTSPQFPDRANSFSTSPPPPLHPSYQHSNNDYPQGDYHRHQIPPSNNTPENPSYSQHYHSQSFSNDHQSPPMYQENPTNNNINNANAIPPPPYSYPNFQSYPSFHDTTLPAAPTHQPSFYQHSDSSSSFPPSGPSISGYTNYDANSSENVMNNHIVTAPQAPVPAPAAVAVPTSYAYDSSYQPSVEKIADAHKAARFAVGALAFDDVLVAVEFLRKSLELLTNPNAETH